jgi:outer membrane protein OmpA-like peptidoglycan-associated protein
LTLSYGPTIILPNDEGQKTGRRLKANINDCRSVRKGQTMRMKYALHVFLLAVFAVLVSPMRASAIVLPEGITPPAGFILDEKPSKFYDFDFLQTSYKKPGATSTERIELTGRTWHIFFKVAPANKTADLTDAAMRASLKAQGWELLTTSGVLVARRIGGGKELWFNGTAEAGYFRAVLVEPGGSPHVLALTPPAAIPETVGDTEDFPYLGRFPGAELLRTEVQRDGSFEASPAGSAEHIIAGPPLVTKRYQLAATTSPYEYKIVYRDALAKEGWDVVRALSGGDVSVIAHYAKNGRDIFCSLHGDWVKVADVGAQNESKKLADALAQDGHVAIYGIYFDVDKATLKPASETALRHVLDLLMQNPALGLEVQGHTDDTGTADHNLSLSEQRAASVMTWLVAHGISGARLTPKGYGATRPAADNKTPEGRAKNRRVELAKK